MSGSTVYLHDDKLVKKLPFVRLLPCSLLLACSQSLAVSRAVCRALLVGNFLATCARPYKQLCARPVVGWWGAPCIASSLQDMRRQLIRSMKKKWDEVNKEYQLLTLSLFNLDTVNKVTKKEACEENMARLEKEINRLSKGHVYVEADVDSIRPGTTA